MSLEPVEQGGGAIKPGGSIGPEDVAGPLGQAREGIPSFLAIEGLQPCYALNQQSNQTRLRDWACGEGLACLAPEPPAHKLKMRMAGLVENKKKIHVKQ